MAGAGGITKAEGERSVEAAGSRTMDVLASLVIAAVAIGGAGLLVAPGVPWGHDLTMHLYRLQALDQHLREGILYPRWFDGFVFGYGYPLLHFYAPLTYYLGEVFHLVGLDLVGSLKAVCLLGRVVGGLGAYWFASVKLRSREAGLVAALAFLLVSYQYTDLFERFSTPELLALNLLPAAFWAVDRVADRLSRGHVAVGAVLLAALVLAHQTTALPSAAAVAAYGAYCLGSRSAGERPSRSPAAAAALLAATGALAVGLSAFFWLPAMADRGSVTLGGQPPGMLPFVDQLLRPGDLVQSGLAFQHSYPDFGRLSLVEVALALAGLPAAIAAPRPVRNVLLCFAGLGVAFVFLMTGPSRPLWEALPFATLMQFPFRLLLYTSFATSILIGGLACLRWKWIARIASVAALAALAASTLWSFQPRLQAVQPEALDEASFARFELARRYPFVGTTTPTQFLPRWVSVAPEELSQPRQGTSDGPAGDLRAGAEVLGRRGYDLALQTKAEGDFTLRYHGFYFPSWGAEVDGRPAEVVPDGPMGLLAVRVPEGTHQVTLGFGRSGSSTLAGLVSAGSAAVVAWLGLTSRPLRRRIPPVVAAAALAGALVAAPSVAAGLTPEVRPAVVRFDSGLTLAGWSARQDGGSPGQPLRLDLYWLARRDVAADYEVVVRLLDSRGEVRASYHRQPRWGSTPTSTWLRGEVVRDAHEVPLPDGLEPGRYAVALGLRRLGEDGAEVHEVGTVELEAPRRARPALPAVKPRRIDFAGGLTLLGYQVGADGSGPSILRPGGSVRVTLLWLARDEMPEDYAASVFLASARGDKLGAQDSYPPHDLDFTAAWRKGDVHVQEFVVPAPDGLAAGLYWLSVEAYEYQTGRRIAVVGGSAPEGTQRVALERLKAPSAPPPAARHPTGHEFGGEIALDGYDLSTEEVPAGGQLDVRLHWRALQAPAQDYTVFVHLYDAEGKLVAQHDGQPQAGAYPTSAWDPGEAVLDEHRLEIEPGARPGQYTLRVGLYLPSSGRRLPLAAPGDAASRGGGDSADLGKVVVR